MTRSYCIAQGTIQSISRGKPKWKRILKKKYIYIYIYIERERERECSWWLSGEEPTADAEDVGSIPGSGRSPVVGNGNPLQYSCMGNPMDREAWWAIVHGVTESQTRLKRLSTCAHARTRARTHTHTHIYIIIVTLLYSRNLYNIANPTIFQF